MKLLVGLYMLFSLSCKTVENNISETSCMEQLKSELPSHWKYIQEKSYYQLNKPFEVKLDTTYRKCIIGMTQKQVIDIFGKPTSVGKHKLSNFRSSLQYLISPPCPPQPTNTYKCYYFIVILDDESKVIDLSFIGDIAFTPEHKEQK